MTRRSAVLAAGIGVLALLATVVAIVLVPTRPDGPTAAVPTSPAGRRSPRRRCRAE